MCAKLLKLWRITKQLYKISAFINLFFIRVRFITKETPETGFCFI